MKNFPKMYQTSPSPSLKIPRSQPWCEFRSPIIIDIHGHAGVLGPKIRIDPKVYCRPKKTSTGEKVEIRIRSRFMNSYTNFHNEFSLGGFSNTNWSINFFLDTTN